MTFDWLDHALFQLAEHWLGVSTFVLNPLIAVVLVGLSCGLVGSLVVGNRMAFFSDAMAHTAFAGVALALLGVILFADVRSSREAGQYEWVVPWVMGFIGIAVGLSITAVRESTGLTNDTVIGVFFALSIGIGAMVLPEVRQFVNLDPEQFLFGSVAAANGADLFSLFVLAILTAIIVLWRYNALVFASLNPSLARSRGLSVRANSYLFIILLALVVNLSIKAVGVLLINALLVVPAAAAANLGRNTRQVFWLTLVGTIAAGVVGLQVHRFLRIPLGHGRYLEPGPGGTIVVVCVLWFFFTMFWKWATGRPLAASADRSG
jgi:zinc transport system permease protein